MARQSVSKHLAVLEAANLVTTIRRGREKLHYLNAAPINGIAERWIDHYDRPRVQALSDLKKALEDTPMNNPDFVYVTYIKTTPEELWRALTEPEFTWRYWGLAFETDWQPGSPMRWDRGGLQQSDPGQVVLASEPFRHLAYTWHAYTPEWSGSAGGSDERVAKIAAEQRSRVSFDLEPQDDQVKLTVVHDNFEPGSEMLRMITGGWPMVLSSLKTMLETGVGEPAMRA
jgi:uncharacterized protein YndB with AHSA1/START domain